MFYSPDFCLLSWEWEDKKGESQILTFEMHQISQGMDLFAFDLYISNLQDV